MRLLMLPTSAPEVLDEGRHSLAGPEAHADDRVASLGVSQMMHRGDCHADARGTRGMANRDAATVQIRPIPGNAVLTLRMEVDDGEGLVDLEIVDVRNLEIVLLEQCADRRRWTRPHDVGRDADGDGVDPARFGLDAHIAKGVGVGHDEDVAPSVTPLELPAVTRPFLRKAGFRFASFSAVTLNRGNSSCENSLDPLPSGTSIGAICRLRKPLSVAALARCWLIRPQASMSARL